MYRVFNFCLALRSCTEEEERKIAIVACFHDIGLWLDNTIDYIPPSIFHLQKYLTEKGLESWFEELSLMVEMHHKVRTFDKTSYPLVEIFRKGDLIDVSVGSFNCGVSRKVIKDIQRKIPEAGFHKFLLRKAKEWFMQHPFSLPPFMKW